MAIFELILMASVFVFGRSQAIGHVDNIPPKTNLLQFSAFAVTVVPYIDAIGF